METKYQLQPYDYLVKLLLLGDSGVGKTNILLRASDDKYSKDFISTIGIDFKILIQKVGDKILKMHVWDTAGQERFQNITANYYKSALGVILVYSVSNMNSFKNVHTWIKQINLHSSDEIVIILIGNKCDLVEGRKVTREQGQKMADEYQIPFMEVSAKCDINVKELFQQIGNDIYGRYKDTMDQGKRDSQLLLSKTPSNAPTGDTTNQTCAC